MSVSIACHNNCRRPGTPPDGMYEDARGDRPRPLEDFTCTVCGRQWVRSGGGWVPGALLPVKA